MTTLSVLAVPSFTEIVQRLTTNIHTITPTFLHRSRVARVIASGAVLLLLYKLIRTRRKPRQSRYVNSTAVGETGGAEYDIIIVGGGILLFLKCD
jgi:hypothetical protein